MSEPSKQLVKAGVVSTPVVVAGAFVVAQVFAMSVITDLIMSVLVFSAGYVTCWLSNRKKPGAS